MIVKIDLADTIHTIHSFMNEKANHKQYEYDPETKLYKSTGLFFKNSLRLEFWVDNEQDFVSSKDTLLYVIISGTRVWATDNPNSVLSYENIGNHESCWIESLKSYITQTYFDIAEDLNIRLTEIYKEPLQVFANFGQVNSIESISKVNISWKKSEKEYFFDLLKAEY